MRRVIIVLDVTEAEAENIVEALVPVSPEHEGGEGIAERFNQAKAVGKAATSGYLVHLRSDLSANLGGLQTDAAINAVVLR